ncbi:unnamed protein product, partial [Closterium sp. NIES-54]
FVRDATADKLSSCAVPCVFLGFPPDAPGWQFYHPTSRRVLSSQDVTFNESGPAPSGVSQVDPAEPVEVAVDSGAARGAYPAVAGPGGAETGGAETGGAETGGAEFGGAESGGALGVPSRREPLSPQRLREWYSRRCRGAAGAGAAGGAGGATGATGGAGAAGGGAGAGATGGGAGAGATGGAAGAGAARGAGGAAGAAGGGGGAGGATGAGAAGGATGATGGAGAAGGGAGAGAARGAAGAGAAGGAAGTRDLGAEGTGSISAVLGSPPSPGPPPFLSPPPVQSQSQLQPASPQPGPSPYSGPTRGLTERREPESCPVSPASRAALPVHHVRAGRVSRPRLPPVPGTHSMTLRPSIASQRVPLPSPLASSLPREWHDTLRTTLAALGFAPSTSDPPLFLRTDATLPPFCVLVYVDDLVFATADTEALAHVKSELQKRHTCTDLEPSGPYPELVGCLMYLMTCTRPDLAYPLSLLARYVAPDRHQKVHWDAAKRVFRYLCSTSGMGLVLGGRTRVVLTGHADASWVDNLATQRSSHGYTFSLGSGSVSWWSTRSSSVLSSSCEAEIYAGAMAAQELRWLTYLLTDLGEAPRSPPVLYVYNKAMLALCQEHRTKHIALRYFHA